MMNIMVRTATRRAARAAATQPFARHKKTTTAAAVGSGSANKNTEKRVKNEAAVAVKRQPKQKQASGPSGGGGAAVFDREVSRFVLPPKHEKCRRQRDATKFEKRVYVACSRIPKGKVSTYGNLAGFLQVGRFVRLRCCCCRMVV